MPKHAISQVGTDAARDFWEQQDDARVFLHPDVLEPLCARVDWWLATWSGQPVCLWPVCHAVDGSHRPPELASYVGPLWHDAVTLNRAHRWWSISSTVERAFLALLASRYGSLEFELPPGTKDIRVLKWFRDDTRDTFEVDIDCRHTALIHGDSDGFAEKLVSGLSRDRQKDLARTSEDLPVPCMPDDREQCFSLYEGLLYTKAVGHVAQRRKRELLKLIDVATAGFGTVLVYRDVDAKVEGFSVSLASRKTASMVIVAASPGARARGLPARLRLEGLLANHRRGMRTFDFLGANSAVGAAEKHRYGAWPELYFRIKVSPR